MSSAVIDAGAQQVWVFYPRQRRFDVHEGPSQYRVLRAEDALDGGAVLPGFRLPVADLYAALVTPPAAGGAS